MLILLLWACACAYQDIRHQRISNRLLYPYLLVAAGWLLVQSESIAGVSIGSAVLGVITALAITLPGHIKGILGGADVKLMAAIGLSIGAIGTLLIIAIATLLLLLWVGISSQLPENAQRVLQHYTPGVANYRQHLAYGPFIFLALAVLSVILALY